MKSLLLLLVAVILSTLVLAACTPSGTQAVHPDALRNLLANLAQYKSEPANSLPVTAEDDAQTGAHPSPVQPPVTSADDIKPGECSLVHNVNACP